MREPTVAWWPGAIPAGSTSDEIATAMDLLPAFATLAGGEVLTDRVIDGKDISPLLRDPAHAKSPMTPSSTTRGTTCARSAVDLGSSTPMANSITSTRILARRRISPDRSRRSSPASMACSTAAARTSTIRRAAAP